MFLGPVVTWKRGGELVTSMNNTGRYRLDSYKGVPNARLTVSNLQYGDRAEYTCEACNRFQNQRKCSEYKILLRVKGKNYYHYFIFSL